MKLKLSDTVGKMLSRDSNDCLYAEYWQARIRRAELRTKVFELENAVRNDPSEENFRKLKLAYRKMQLMSDYTGVLMEECVLCGIRDLTDAPMLEMKAAKQEGEIK